MERYFYLSSFFRGYFYFYLSSFLGGYFYFYLVTFLEYLLQHCVYVCVSVCVCMSAVTAFGVDVGLFRSLINLMVSGFHTYSGAHC